MPAPHLNLKRRSPKGGLRRSGLGAQRDWEVSFVRSRSRRTPGKGQAHLAPAEVNAGPLPGLRSSAERLAPRRASR